MATAINAGSQYFIYNLSVSNTADTAFQVTTGYTPTSTGNTPTGYVQGQIMNANTILVKCRTAVDLYLRKEANSTEYFTIPSGTTFEFKINPANTQNLFYLRSGSGTVTAEILVYNE